jgi:hypothetical protein
LNFDDDRSVDDDQFDQLLASYLDAKVVLLAAEELEVHLGVDVDHVGAGVGEEVEERVEPVVGEPVEQVPLVAIRRGVLVRLLGDPRPDGEHEDVPVHARLRVLPAHAGLLPLLLLHGDQRGHGGRGGVILEALRGGGVGYSFSRGGEAGHEVAVHEVQVLVLQLPAEADHLLGEQGHGGHGGVVGRDAAVDELERVGLAAGALRSEAVRGEVGGRRRRGDADVGEARVLVRLPLGLERVEQDGMHAVHVERRHDDVAQRVGHPDVPEEAVDLLVQELAVVLGAAPDHLHRIPNEPRDPDPSPAKKKSSRSP